MAAIAMDEDRTDVTAAAPFRTITRFEPTPNPNAVKCWLDRPLRASLRSFLNAEAAADDPIASALFAAAPITTLLFAGSWLTINKSPEASWPAVKKAAGRVLADVDDGDSPG